MQGTEEARAKTEPAAYLAEERDERGSLANISRRDRFDRGLKAFLAEIHLDQFAEAFAEGIPLSPHI